MQVIPLLVVLIASNPVGQVEKRVQTGTPKANYGPGIYTTRATGHEAAAVTSYSNIQVPYQL